MNGRKLLITVIILVCVLSFAYVIYLLFCNINKPIIVEEEKEEIKTYDFDKLFDNKMNYQNYVFGSEYKMDTSKELVYTIYELNEKSEDNYDINVKLPYINLKNSKANDINTEIISIFGQKVQSIMADKSKASNTIYTVEYTAYLNENILSILIKSTLKEGNNAQRLIIKAYTYNLSSNELIPLKTMIDIKELDQNKISNIIQKTIKEEIEKKASLTELGYNVYKRDLNNEMYKIENSNNYFLGPKGTIFIIYAYGNNKYTAERDIIVIE